MRLMEARVDGIVVKHDTTDVTTSYPGMWCVCVCVCVCVCMRYVRMCVCSVCVCVCLCLCLSVSVLHIATS